MGLDGVGNIVSKESLFYDFQTAKHKAIKYLFKKVAEARKKEIEDKRISARKRELEGEHSMVLLMIQAIMGVVPENRIQPEIVEPRASLMCNRV